MTTDFEDIKKELDELMNQHQGSYKLDENNLAIPCTLKEHLELYGGDNRINRRMFKEIVTDYIISTVFWGQDVGFDEDEPILFETLIFDGGYETYVYSERCSTYEQAKDMHAKAIQLVKDGYNFEEENSPSL